VAEERQPERRGPPGHGSVDRRRGLLPVAAAVGLLALVAVGSLRGPLGSGRGRPSYPADLVDSLLLLLFLAMIAAGVLAVVALWPNRHLPVRGRRAGSWNLILPAAAILLLWLFRDLLGLDGGRRDEDPATTLPTPTSLDVSELPADPGVVPLFVAGLALLAMVAVVVAQMRADRRRRRPPLSRAERLVGLLDDTLEDLERDPDPRRAVIAAWARMEHGLAAAGLPRRPYEAPFEYAARVLETSLAPIHRGGPAPGPLRPDSVHRLTGLFERAKFSQHTIGPDDRDEAVAALRAVRRELVEAAELADQAVADSAADPGDDPSGQPASRAAGGPGAGGGDGR
jgi:hypothetical protein